MSGAESHAFGPGASDSEQRPYGEQQFDPPLLGQEFSERMQLFNTFVMREVHAFELHRAVTATLTEKHGKPTYVDQGPDGFRRYYPQVNYDPMPGDSDQRRFIKIGEHVTLENVYIPLMAVYKLEEMDKGVPPACSFVRGEMGSVHQLLQGRLVSGSKRNYAEIFLMQDPSQSERVQKQLATQVSYVGWLKAVASYIGVPPVMRQYTIPAEQQISPHPDPQAYMHQTVRGSDW